MIVVGFYTENSPYEYEAAELVETLVDVGVDYHLEGHPHRGSWMANIIIKADFCRWMLASWAHKAPVVFLDCDARMRKYPVLFESLPGSGCDLAIGWLDHPKSRWLSNVLVMWPSLGCWNFLDAWVLKNRDRATHHGPADENNIPWAIEQSGAAVSRLPPEYACVADMNDGTKFTRGAHPDIEPVIEQLQASRRLKGEMNVRQ